MNDKKRMDEKENPTIALIHINNVTQVNEQAKPAILSCYGGGTFNYVKLGDPPECHPSHKHKGILEKGTLTIYADNEKVQSEQAWTCQIMVNTIKLKCVHLQQTREPQGQSIMSVDIGVCQQWMKDKACKYGSMTSFGDRNALSWKTKNPLKVSYNHWWRVCGVNGKPRYFTSYNCLMVPVDITYQAPFLELFSPAVGRMPLKSLGAGGVQKSFKTIAWTNETSNAFWHVCRKVVSLTIPVVRMIYASMKDASEHRRITSTAACTNETVYQFMSTDEHSLLYTAKEKDRTTLSALEAGHCGHDFPDTFVSNTLILQYVSDTYLAKKQIPRYTGVKHAPTIIGFHEDLQYKKAQNHVNLWRTANVSHELMCSGGNMKSTTHKCVDGKAVDIKTRKRRDVRPMNPAQPLLVQAMLDFMEGNQVQNSIQLASELMYQLCLEQRQVHALQTVQLQVDPSPVFSSFMKHNVHVIPKGDLYSLQYCERLSCSTLRVIPSLKTTYPPMRRVYKNKGVVLSDDIIFTKPIIQYNTSTGIEVTVQLQKTYYACPHLTFTARQPKYHPKENLVSDIMVFEICGYYYIFENATHVDKVEVDHLGTEQHIIREYWNNKPTYHNKKDNNTSNGRGTGTMYIKTFCGPGQFSLHMPKAAFYGLQKASYYTQDDMLSHLHSFQDYFAATVRMQDAITYMEATIGKEHIHATVGMMGDVLHSVVDSSVAGGEAVGGFLGSVAGSTAGMTVQSFTGMAAKGITSFLDSIFSKIVLVIGMGGGYLAILVTLVYCGMSAYMKNWNIFGTNNRKKKMQQKKGKKGNVALNNENDTQEKGDSSNKGCAKNTAWDAWLTK